MELFHCDEMMTFGLPGDVAQMCRQTQSLLVAPQTLTIQQVYSTLVQIRLVYLFLSILDHGVNS